MGGKEMGLSTTHGAWNGSYGGFSAFREAVCIAAGLPTRPSSLGGRDIAADWDNVTEDQIMGHWGDVAPCVTETIYGPHITDPLLYLLIHSDCEGVLENSYLVPLRDRLQEILPKLNDEGLYSMRWEAQRFIDGLDSAIAADEDIEFG